MSAPEPVVAATTLSHVVASRLRRVALLALFVVTLASCDIDILVDVDVANDGSGVVEVDVILDEEAALRVPDLFTQLRLDDLVESGWDIDGPAVTLDDGVQITARRKFDGPEQLQFVLDDITGPDGAFQDFVVSREAEFAQVDLDLSGVVDLSRGLDLFTDAELVEALDGRPLGIDLQALEAEIGPIGNAINFQFSARLPGTTEDESEGAEITVNPRLGDDPLPVALSTTDEDTFAMILRIVGYAAAALAAVAMFVNIVIWVVEWRRRRAEPAIRTPEPLRPMAPAHVGRGERVAPAAPVAAPPRVAGRQISMVVVDAYGVLYEPLFGALVAFARSRGSTLDDTAMAAHYDLACEGRKSTAELWMDLGVPGDPRELDLGFVGQIRLRSGARDFVRELRRRGMNVTAVGNNVGTWSDMLRDRDKLGDVEPWINSSEAGVRSPHPGLFETMRRTTGVAFESWLMIHADLDSLDAAKTLGMTTVWFTRELPPANERPAHSIVRGFADFFRRR